MMLAPAACAWAQVGPVQSPAQAKTYTLTLGTKLMVVDVTVKDKHGNPVHGLKLSDFRLNENGKPQQIKNFDEHTALTAEEIARLPAFPKLPPGDFTNLVRTPPNAALNVILIDRLNTALSDQTYLTEQLLKYARQARPDARTAVFGLSDRLLLLQGFSSDPAVLLKTLESSNKPKESGNRVGVPGHSGAESMTVDPRMLDTIQDQFGSGGGAAQVQNIKEFEHQAVSDLNRDRAKTTLDALNQLGRVLINLPGRKNLVWFSGDFPPQFFPGDSDPKLPDMQFAGLADEFQSTVNLLTRARVAVYPVDAQGLRASQFNNASSGNPQLVHRQTPQDARNGPEYGQEMNTETETLVGEHAAMGQIAADTGGTAFFNTNDLATATRQAIDEGSEFYTLSYTPASDEDKPDYRNISIKLADKDYHLSYRRGYYADNESNPNRTVLAQATQPASHSSGWVSLGDAKSVEQPDGRQATLRRVLMLGSPEPTEIVMRIHVALASEGEDPEVVQGNSPNRSKMHGPYKKYLVQFAASPRNVAFTHGDDNLYHAELDFLTCVYGSEGLLLNVQSNTVRGDYDANGMRELLRTGIHFEQRISVPIHGDSFLRTVVRDAASGHLGAIELPVASIGDVSVPEPTLKDRRSP